MSLMRREECCDSWELASVKRLLDLFGALVGLLVSSPVLVPAIVLVWAYDRHSPFYVAPRVGCDGRLFKMVKLRSMRINADRIGVDSTSSRDPRITPIGHFIRRYKLDELTQLWNVLWGDMSLVGPRPNVERETRLYTREERELLTVRPGITDFASVVFADEGEILKDQRDPDIAYNQLIRPWKSRLGIFYVRHSNVRLDLQLIRLTALAIVSRERALRGVHNELVRLAAPADLAHIALRTVSLEPLPPPGATEIVTSRQ
jgi:lipopolysaccharide/colanic/teichoic acid biosynthesis glycosyltransferase